jgi:hypothetical protein
MALVFEEGPADLSNEEKLLIKQYVGSELFQVLRKAFTIYQRQVYQTLLQADRDHLPAIQGQLKGIQGCLNLMKIHAATAQDPQGPDEPKSTVPIKPLTSAKDRK